MAAKVIRAQMGSLLLDWCGSFIIVIFKKRLYANFQDSLLPFRMRQYYESRNSEMFSFGPQL